jgi:hypothetical protein
MRKAKWWTVDLSFAVAIGLVMTGTFATAFVAPHSARRSDSALVPAAVLQKLIDRGGECQTRTDEDVDNHTPPKRC